MYLPGINERPVFSVCTRQVYEGKTYMYFKERIAAGEYLLGAGMFCASPEVVEYCAKGMDWVWLEAQHTHADWQTLIHCARAAHAINVPTLVRTWTHDTGTVERLLDMGVEGVIVPMINTAEQAREVVSHCYYPPLGKRSFGSLRMERIEESTTEWNKRMVTMVQIETPEAVNNAEAIARVPGVDILNVGIRDLAMRQNIEWELDKEYAVLSDQIKHVISASKKAGKATCVIALTPKSLTNAIGDGCQLICAGMEVDHLVISYQVMGKAFKELANKRE
jgi:4-hydroxy-2-oxoheptanedioate aldolase